MKCDICKKEQTWLEHIGKEFVCHPCLRKHKILGKVLRTHAGTFSYIVKKLGITNYVSLMAVSLEDIRSVTDLRKIGIVIK